MHTEFLKRQGIAGISYHSLLFSKAKPVQDFPEDVVTRPRGREMTKIPRWCEHCNRPGHTREKCWKLHGTPPRGYKGCAPQDSTSDKEKQFSSRSTPFLIEKIDKLFNMRKSPNKERIKGHDFLSTWQW